MCLMASFLLSHLLLMKVSIIDTNTANAVSIKCISPSVLAMNYSHLKGYSTPKWKFCH